MWPVPGQAWGDTNDVKEWQGVEECSQCTLAGRKDWSGSTNISGYTWVGSTESFGAAIK